MAALADISRLLPLDEAYEALKKVDPVWLESTIQARWQAKCALTHQANPAQAPDIEKTQHSTPAAVTDHDITAIGDTTIFSGHIQRFKQHDWAATELGPMSSWPPELRRMINVCLQMPVAVAIWWGSKRHCLFNETYAAMLGDQACTALGMDIHDVWQGLRAETDMFQTAMTETVKTGLPSHGKGCLCVQRKEGLEETWISFTLLPLLDSSGNKQFIHIMVDHTKDVVNERRTAALLSLQQRTATITTLEELSKNTLDALKPYSRDIPYAALYQISDFEANQRDNSLNESAAGSAREWLLAGVNAASSASVELPATLDTAAAFKLFGVKFESALTTGEIQTLSVHDSPIAERLWTKSACTGSSDRCNPVLLIPVFQGHSRELTSFLIIGINPRIAYDEQHRAFAELLQHYLHIALHSLINLENQRRLTKLGEQLVERERACARKLDGVRQDSKLIEARFHRMADRSPVAMFEVGADGELKYANDSWFEMTGHPRDQLAPLQWVSVIHPEDRGWFAEKWGRLVAGETLHFDIRFAKRFVSDDSVDGRHLEGTTWAAASAYAERDDEGNVLNVLGTTADISRLKWLEGFQSRRATEALELKQQQEAFMDMISHEARNPLSAITLCAENSVSLLSHQGSVKIPDKETIEATLDDLNTILACANHQKNIIDDVLTLSKIKNSMLTVCPVPVQPSRIVVDTLTTFAASVAQSDLDLIFHTDVSRKTLNVDWVLLDPVRVQQILMNLVSNAVKFTKDKTGVRRIDVTLSAQKNKPEMEGNANEAQLPAVEESSAASSSLYLSFAVRDTGSGIKTEYLDRLFERFTQGSIKTHVKYGGSGLGLYICKMLALLQDGHIDVVSTYRKGSTFTFLVKTQVCPAPLPLPHRTTAGVSQTPVATATAQGGAQTETTVCGNHLLLVEDNLVNQKVMAKLLRRLGYVIAVANHGQEALDYLATTKLYRPGGEELDMVLMDIEMPIMNGLDCVREIRKLESTTSGSTRLPIAAVTANARKEQQDTALAHGFDAVITKPFQIDDLQSLLSQYGLSIAH